MQDKFNEGHLNVEVPKKVSSPACANLENRSVQDGMGGRGGESRFAWNAGEDVLFGGKVRRRRYRAAQLIEVQDSNEDVDVRNQARVHSALT